MAELGQSFQTLIDLYKTTEGGKTVARIIDLMKQTNPILDDAIAVEANQITNHVSTQFIDLPKGQFRRYNQGVKAEKSVTQKVTDNMGMLETFLKTDVDMAKLSTNESAYRMLHVKAAMSGLGITMGLNMFYANNALEDEKFLGLAPRYSKFGNDQGRASYNVIDCGGSANANTSAYMVTWGDTTAHTIYPRGSKAGIQHQDLGQQLTKDDAGGEFMAYVNHLKWDLGISIPNWKYNGRAANIDVASLKTIGQSADASKNLEMLLIDLVDRRPDERSGRTVIYVNRDLHSAIRKQAANKKNAYLRLQDFGGKQVTYFDNIEIKRCDAILSTEANVIQEA